MINYSVTVYSMENKIWGPETEDHKLVVSKRQSGGCPPNSTSWCVRDWGKLANFKVETRREVRRRLIQGPVAEAGHAGPVCVSRPSLPHLLQRGRWVHPEGQPPYSDGVAGPPREPASLQLWCGWSVQRASLPTAMVWPVPSMFPAQHPRGGVQGFLPRGMTWGSGCAGLSSPWALLPTRSAEPSRCPSTALHSHSQS